MTDKVVLSLSSGGRLRHFASVTSPLTLLASSTELANAQQFLKEYQAGQGKGRQAWGHEQEMGVWKAKQRKARPVQKHGSTCSESF